HKIYGIGEGADEILLGFVDNILIASFSKKLFVNALQQYKEPHYSKSDVFTAVRSAAYDKESGESLAKIHINYDQLDEMMGVYMDDVTSTVTSLSTIMEYSSFDLKMRDDHAKLSGITAIDTAEPSFLKVMQNIDRSEIRSHQVLPGNTSFMLTIDYHDFDFFYDQVATFMKDDKGFKDFEKTKKSVGGFLGVTMSERKAARRKKRGKDDDYFDWIGQEIGLAMVPMNGTGSQQAYVALFHTPDKENAVRDLKQISKKIKNRTPVKFKTYDYKGYDVNYLHMGGFFRLFLGKLFKKFDKPKYTILDEFVVFSNDTAAIHRVIDVANGVRPSLPMDAGYRNFFRNFEPNSNYFLYVNTHNLYGYLPGLLGGESARGVRKNKKYITCFPRAGLQLISNNGLFQSELYFEFDTEDKGGLFQSF
ncbi:MAG: DUF3352 domain-containing protein, partial [Bacteroidota bacterium]